MTQENNLILDEEEGLGLTKKGKPRKRKPKQKNYYFTDDTQEAILKYVASTDQDERNRIYNKEIAHAFYKLVENIIHTFKFYYMDVDDIEDLKHECIIFLLERLHLYNQSKNVCDKFGKMSKEAGEEYEAESFQRFTNFEPKIQTEQILEFVETLKISDDLRKEFNKVRPPKAYSYFGTIIKRYLIQYNKDNYKKLINSTSVSEVDTDKSTIIDLENNHDPYDLTVNSFFGVFTEYVYENLDYFFPKKNDYRVADAILTIFQQREDLEVINKRAFNIYVKEIVDVPTRNITKVNKKLEEIYKDSFLEYENYGYLTTPGE